MAGSQAIPGIADMLQRAFEHMREQDWPAARKWAMREADLLGGAASEMPEKQVLHTQGSYNLTNMFGNVLPPEPAANAADALYMLNEALTGTMSAATGRPFLGPYGFSWPDIGLNRKGQERAIAELAERWKGMRQEEPAPRFMYRGVE